MIPSGWAVRRFGESAGPLQQAVVAAIAEAHADAVAAQVASGTRKRDPYGHTMKNRQHECLVERVRAGEVPGAEVIHPRGAFFELVRIPATNALIFPWRYAVDGTVSREDARMRTSGVRRDLLAGVATGRGQLSLDHAEVADADLETQLAEEEALAAELRSFARVVTVGYASNPTGILDLGWGDAELVGEDGTVDWAHWEPLTAPAEVHRADGRGQHTDPAGLRPALDPTAAPRQPRFDDVPLDGDFGLQPRGPLAGEPQPEAAPEAPGTGAGEERP
jgi:hypothetical protein